MRVWLALAVFASLASTAHADGDPLAGKKVFTKCAACHDGVSANNRVGPYLLGVVGRPAASVETFKYSDAMKAAGAAGVVWNEETLAKYLRSPKTVVPGTKMIFAGLKKDDEIADVIAWLKADPKP